MTPHLAARRATRRLSGENVAAVAPRRRHHAGVPAFHSSRCVRARHGEGEGVQGGTAIARASGAPLSSPERGARGVMRCMYTPSTRKNAIPLQVPPTQQCPEVSFLTDITYKHNDFARLASYQRGMSKEQHARDCLQHTLLITSLPNTLTVGWSGGKMY
ncbi:hypothetical protein E2C01_089424 [Portunus trituberculatus]|uniref:Uncharacterized protein n=1 Tax=Portunus trituberculatus TaxID=210409 RepID=A0A5B7JDI5_PORTR|nr:hypothetical protein [Portunus trituberculatus]